MCYTSLHFRDCNIYNISQFIFSCKCFRPADFIKFVKRGGCSGDGDRGTWRWDVYVEGSVAMIGLEEHGDGTCILRFCSGGLGRKTGR